MGNFRLTGGSYASKDGNTGNSGLTPLLPKQTASQAAAVGTGDIIIQAGDYTESAYNNASRALVGDGLVRIKGVNPASSTFSGIPKNLTLQGFQAVTITGNTASSNSIISDCPNVTYSSSITQFDNVILVNCLNIIATNGGALTTRTSFINSTFTIVPAVTYSNLYLDYYSILSVATATGTRATNCNIQGAVLMGGVYYCVPTGTDIVISGGTATVPAFSSRTMPTGTYPALATDWLHNAYSITATLCYFTNKVFNKNPKYVDVSNKNFDYLPDSPHIGTLIGGSSGRVVLQSAIAQANTFTNLVNMTGTSNLIPTSTSGSATSPVVTIDSVNPRLVGYIGYGGELNYNISTTAPATGVNDNVPFVGSYTKNGTTVTNTGCRPCVMIRFSNKSTTPSATVDSDWDNGNGSTSTVTGVLPGEWFLAELNQVFRYDSNGFGNGDNNFSGSGNQIQARYYQTRVVLVDNYNQG